MSPQPIWTLGAAALLVVACGPTRRGAAPTGSSGGPPASAATARELVLDGVVGTDPLRRPLEGLMLQSIGGDLSQRLGRPLNEAEQLRVRATVHRLMTTVFSEAVITDVLVGLLSTHMSEADAQAILAFYRTPAGRRMRELPRTLMPEVEAATRGLIQQNAPEIQAIIEQELGPTLRRGGGR